MRTTKKTLTLSILSVLLCVAMLVGTTFAWFSDSVTSGANKIVAGTLSVDLLMDKEENGTYVSIADEDGAIFGSVNSLFAQNESFDTLWEPGKTQIVYLGVKNTGTVALKYNIIIDVEDGGLASALQYAIIDGAKAENLSAATCWGDLAENPAVQSGAVLAGRFVAASNGILDEISEGTMDETDYFAFAVHMREDAGIEYMGKEINIDLTVVAAQVSAENDSFGKDYDRDAVFPEIAGNEPGLEELFETLSEGGAEIPERIIVAHPVTLKALSDEFDGLAAELDGVTTTIDLQSTLSVGDNYSPFNAFGAMRVQGQNSNFSDVTFTGSGEGKFTGVGSDVCALVYTEANYKLTFAGGTYETEGQVVLTNFMGTGTNQTIAVTGGTFIFVGADKDHQVPFVTTNAGITAFLAHHGMPQTLTVTGGTFYNCDPSAYVPSGHTVTNDIVGNDIIYTVN